ncbi:uncharacterized protein ARMOST_02017 [Armillaria ostoyae]|uniref:Uncharacterized protein n=1 Tax=Armillaria ostoyae TaxID=47428 RepID=A0A284QQM0_ARMOS|nr:uncharacterized protein ARMOST_02017 [Armillaria ostoyae]
MAIWKRIRSVFSTSRTSRDPSPDETPILDENPNATVSSEPREQHSCSASEDAGPALEATPDSSSCLQPESPSIVDSQTDATDEQPSEDTSGDSFEFHGGDYDPWPPEESRSANCLHPESPSIVDMQSNASEEQPSEDTSGDSSVFHGNDDDPWPPEDISLPKVTISDFTETGQAKSSIVVPKQRAYTGRKPVISSRLADIPCATLGVQGLLDQLNSTLGTSIISLMPIFLHIYPARAVLSSIFMSTMSDQSGKLHVSGVERISVTIFQLLIVQSGGAQASQMFEWWISNLSAVNEHCAIRSIAFTIVVYDPKRQEGHHASDWEDLWTRMDGCLTSSKMASLECLTITFNPQPAGWDTLKARMEGNFQGLKRLGREVILDGPVRQ